MGPGNHGASDSPPVLAPAGGPVAQTSAPVHSLRGLHGAQAWREHWMLFPLWEGRRQQIIKLMSTFIAVKAVKASHGVLIKSHKAYLQSHIIFVVIQTSSILEALMCSAGAGVHTKPSLSRGGGGNLVCLDSCVLLIQGQCLSAITQKVKSCDPGVLWAKGRDSPRGPRDLGTPNQQRPFDWPRHHLTL